MQFHDAHSPSLLWFYFGPFRTTSGERLPRPLPGLPCLLTTRLVVQLGRSVVAALLSMESLASLLPLRRQRG